MQRDRPLAPETQRLDEPRQITMQHLGLTAVPPRDQPLRDITPAYFFKTGAGPLVLARVVRGFVA